MEDNTKRILKTVGIIAGAGITGYAIYYIFMRKTAEGITLFKKWTGGGMPNLGTGQGTGQGLPGVPNFSTNKSGGVTAGSNKSQGGSSSSSSSTSVFPLKVGDKNQFVKNMQLALIKNIGSSALPIYGADSDFGGETIAAVKKMGYNSPVSQADYNNILSGITAGTATAMANILSNPLGL